jgi:molybdenum cofactor guanylyltransferase
MLRKSMAGTIPVVIMAGGAGQRMGGRKPFQCVAGESLLNHAIAKANCYSHTVAIAAGSEKITLHQEIRLLPDEIDFQGPIAGLQAAIQFGTELGTRHVMIMPCDTPFLPEDLLTLLQNAIGIAQSAVPQYAGHLHPACSLWSTEILSLLGEYLATGRRSLIGFAELTEYISVEIPTVSYDPFFNINTVEDMAQAEQNFSDLNLHK